MQTSAELIGQVLCDRYQIEKQLGQKTGRRTFGAIDLQTESPVVIKLLIFNNEFIWDDLKLFEREAETLKHLDLPAIPRYLDYFEFDLPNLKGFALVQTYLETMTEVSLNKRFSAESAAQLALTRLGESDSIVREKPYGSNIVLIKNAERIEIIIPNRSFPTVWGLIAALSISMMFVSGSLVFFPILLLLQICIYFFLGKLHLRIDRYMINFRKQLGTAVYGRQAPDSPRSKIDRLTCNRYTRKSGRKKISLLNREIVIRAGIREYRIQSSSEAECEWLLAELSEWLNLPVSK